MGQVLHGCATTTEAVRRAIQHSQESLRELSRHYGINPKTDAAAPFGAAASRRTPAANFLGCARRRVAPGKKVRQGVAAEADEAKLVCGIDQAIRRLAGRWAEQVRRRRRTAIAGEQSVKAQIFPAHPSGLQEQAPQSALPDARAGAHEAAPQKAPAAPDLLHRRAGVSIHPPA